MPFATWDPGQLSAVTLSNGNLTATASGAGGVRGQGTNRSGKWYWEITLPTWANANTRVGACTAAATVGSFGASTPPAFAVTVRRDGGIYLGSASTGLSLGARANGDVIGIALDLDAGKVWFRAGASGNWNGSTAHNPATGQGGVSLASLGYGGGANWYPMAGFGAANDQAVANFGASALVGAVPGGFTAGWTTDTAITHAVASTAGAEVWARDPGTLRMDAAGAEVWFFNRTEMLVTAAGAEVWFVGSAVALRRRRVVALLQ
ncbi:hypothetical protein GCM10010964_18790 [Caldovatus sediminis]|uniref:B30.2/SPRY domain-containing protein n=1 Tax=Caldovatus sediminis TaxID=2041189 RepID=A0A8J2ZB03_9PROT|nr:SPRY domain-containing protein [Caldovatus sediminis]GGG31089.1 hypothetical protein GCM10010964_18790 [Caldovatus sediminis]